MSARPLLPEDKRTPQAADKIAGFHKDIVEEVRAAVERDPVVLVGMAQNPVVKRAREALTEAGIQYTYLEYGSYFGKWKERLAIKMWSGWPTFPQVFVNGELIGGADLTKKGIRDGTLRTANGAAAAT